MIKILIVDDDQVLTRVIEAHLTGMGYVVDKASDGLDALVKLKRQNYAAVILDVMIPEINGYDICYQLRFNPSYAHIPIILLTERDREIDLKVMERTGITYLSKPVKAKELTDAVQILVKAEGANQ